MNMLMEIFPIITFFITYKLSNIFFATISIMFASFLQILMYKLFLKKINLLQWITFFFIILFGLITILLKDDIYIKLKPSVIYFILSIIFYSSHFIGNKDPIIKKIMQSKIALPIKIWNKISYSWIIFFIILSFTNVFIAYNYETEIWVYFKTFGILISNIFLLILQFFLVYKHIKFK